MFLWWNSPTLLLLNVIERELSLLALLEKWTSSACLFGSELNFIFHWRAQLLSFSRSLFHSCETHLSQTKENRDVSSAKIFYVELRLSLKSFIYIKNKSGPRTEPCGILDFITSQEEHWPLRTIYSLLVLLKIILKEV